ncbi:MFS transporter [Ovoidimarina sediminis]|uniref:MFS transporter n=1 Tax=Ovoidimarina sediminis TaxID=3079856 RepID=UPI00290F2481|nr:MFS transporter [Rhodophyticola sp. MJ-SS7]MDU8945043.1 MFS transporter [Rhodophyticola sp. MJ-SS7]
MIQVLGSSWAILLGLLLLMLGNGIQGTLLGIRGAIEGFSTYEMSLVMSAYFLGFFGGSRMTPRLIQRVGHVRVFAALGSFTSAVLILFPTLTDPWAWVFLRVLIGFCFSGIYVTVESWLNNAVENENRGKALSLYLIVQMAGIISAQGLVAVGDPSGFVLFIIPSVLVSIAFAPILLSATPTPSFETTKPMGILEVFQISPLGCVGVFVLGGVFSAMFGMAAVYATEAGYSVGQISLFVAMIYVGGLLLQFPIGWVSDRMDRRILILGVSALGGAAALIGSMTTEIYWVIIGVAFFVGGTANPLYALLLAYVNDYLDGERMAGASGALIFVNGIGAIAGPLVIGWLMAQLGPRGFWLFVAILMLGLAAYAVWRMGRRPMAVPVEETVPYAPITPVASPVATQLAQEYYADTSDEIVSDSATNETSRDHKS